jgi:hypothetical protein
MRQSIPAELRQSVRDLVSSPTLSRVSMYAISVAVYAIIPAWFEAHKKLSMLSGVPSDIHAALTLVLGWLLVFRTNTSYGRWWEARTLWGSLVNTMRNLSLKLVNLIEVPKGRSESASKNSFCLCTGVEGPSSRRGAPGRCRSPRRTQRSSSARAQLLVSLIYTRLREWKNSAILMVNT